MSNKGDVPLLPVLGEKRPKSFGSPLGQTTQRYRRPEGQEGTAKPEALEERAFVGKNGCVLRNSCLCRALTVVFFASLDKPVNTHIIF